MEIFKKESKTMKFVGQFILLIFTFLILSSLLFPLLINALGPKVHSTLLYGIIVVIVGLVFWKIKNLPVRPWTIAGLAFLAFIVMIWCNIWIFNYTSEHQSKTELQQATMVK
ncbi:MAG: hypothetical protein H7336_15085 [Bacteriovorax sp.]|nr:hypothetical protein [Bacteriovorax sp.]